MNNTDSIKKLQNYISNNEVVFQVYGELLDVANELEKENKAKLLGFLSHTSSIEIYKKDHFYIMEEFAELNNWSQKDDILILLQTVGVLICITKKDALDNHLIAA